MNLFMKALVALSFTLCLAACSSSSDSKKNTNEKPTGGSIPADPNAPAGDLMTLPMTAWCTTRQDQGRTLIGRVKFESNENPALQVMTLTVYNANPDGSRGNEAGRNQGTWEITNGNDLVIRMQRADDAHMKIYVYRSDDSPTKAPQLLLADDQGTTAWDPCE